MKFIVERKTWYRGNGSSSSMLLRDDGTRCCIGFVGKQCGIADGILLHRGAAHQVDAPIRKWPVWFKVGEAASPLSEAYTINDDPSLSEPVREEKLISLFAENGDEIVFVD
jgi:hypothetical protein